MTMITKSDTEAVFEAQVAREIIEGAIKQSTVLSLFRRLPNMSSNTTKLRVLDALPMAYWVDAEDNNGRKKTTKMAWANKYITAEELAVIVPIKEDTLADADVDLWAEIKPRLVEAIGKKIDSAVLLGDDKPRGFRMDLLTSVINSGAQIEQGMDQTLYSAINDAMVKVEESGYNVTGILGGVDLKGKFRMMLDTTGQPIAGTEIGNIPRFYVDNGAWDKTKATMILGDFSQAVYAIRQDITYKILDQAVIQNPSTGEIEMNLPQEDMVALRVVFRFGYQIPNGANALAPDEEARFPFAVIKGTSGATTQNVTFTVTDSNSDNVEGVKVSLGGAVGTTNASGQAVLKAQAGTYTYTAKKGSARAAGSVTVASSAVSVNIVNF